MTSLLVALTLALWMRDASHWTGTTVERVKLDAAVRLQMRVGETQTLLPVIAGSTARSNLYLDLCLPVDGFDVAETAVWPAADPEYWDCARYSAYMTWRADAREHAPRESLRFRARAAGTFAVRYRIVTPEGAPVTGEFPVSIVP